MTIFSHLAVEIVDPKDGHDFKVNGQRLKPFLEDFLQITLLEKRKILFLLLYISFRSHFCIFFGMSLLFMF